MSTCPISEYQDDSTENEIEIKTSYCFGHLIIKDGESYKLKGLGGSGIHSFTKLGGSSMIYVRESDIAALTPKEPTVPANVSISHHVEDDLSYVEVIIHRSSPVCFDMKKKHLRDLLFLFNDNESLLSGDKSLSLFESESIMDKIPKMWMHQSSAPIPKI